MLWLTFLFLPGSFHLTFFLDKGRSQTRKVESASYFSMQANQQCHLSFLYSASLGEKPRNKLTALHEKRALPAYLNAPSRLRNWLIFSNHCKSAYKRLLSPAFTRNLKTAYSDHTHQQFSLSLITFKNHEVYIQNVLTWKICQKGTFVWLGVFCLFPFFTSFVFLC